MPAEMKYTSETVKGSGCGSEIRVLEVERRILR